MRQQAGSGTRNAAILHVVLVLAATTVLSCTGLKGDGDKAETTDGAVTGMAGSSGTGGSSGSAGAETGGTVAPAGSGGSTSADAGSVAPPMDAGPMPDAAPASDAMTDAMTDAMVDAMTDTGTPCTPNDCGGCAPLSGEIGASCGDCGKYVCNSTIGDVECTGADKNACGGCTALIAAPGATCGCSGGSFQFVCDGMEAVKYSDPGANTCGGCGVIAETPGAACGTCGSYECNESDTAVTCAGDHARNACNGCSALANAPTTSCGPCSRGTWMCSGQNATACMGDPGLNACGGCSALSNAPGGTCGTCSRGAYMCNGQNAVQCVGDSTNACGGCMTLANAPGGTCGTCSRGTYMCSGQNATACMGDPGRNACNGCTTLPNAPGTSCGACGGSWACNGTDAVRCNGDPGLNACGGCGTLTAAPNTACNGCGTWTCNGAKTQVTCDMGTCSHCETQTRPSGVAANDYACLDFDEGSLPPSGWTSSNAASGSTSLSTTRFLSGARSLTSTVQAESSVTGDAGRLRWTSPDGNTLSSASVTAHINPGALLPFQVIWSGDVELLCILGADTDVCVSYVPSSAEDRNQNVQRGFAGLMLREFYHGTIGVWTTNYWTLSPGWAGNVWNKIELVCSGASLDCRVLLNNTQIGAAGFLGANSRVTVDVGVHANATTDRAYTANFDNVTVSVKR